MAGLASGCADGARMGRHGIASYEPWVPGTPPPASFHSLLRFTATPKYRDAPTLRVHCPLSTGPGHPLFSPTLVSWLHFSLRSERAS